jgi:photosystem II stability/assembly factor-like uncharacterized protein
MMMRISDIEQTRRMLVWGLVGIICIFVLAGCSDDATRPVTEEPEQSVWIWQNPVPSGNVLQHASFVDSLTGTAVGGCGTILKTTDGGASWVQQESGTHGYLRSIHFSDAYTGTIVGDNGIILRTEDGGTTWESQASYTYGDIRAVSFCDRNNGIAVGQNGAVLRTADGGAHWTHEWSGTSNTLWGIWYEALDHALIVGHYGTILAELPAVK